MNTLLIKFLFGFSVFLNIAFIVVAIWLLLLGGFLKLFIYPFNQRQITQFEMLGTSSSDVVFLGDSLIAEGRWDELFPITLVRNRGLPGDTAVGVFNRLDQITKGKPSKVFLMVGINDIGMRRSEDEIVSTIMRIIDKIHSDSPVTKIFVHSILPNRISLKEKIESVNTRIEREVEDKAVWINLYPLFLVENKGALKKSLSNDSMHLVGQGYDVWKHIIEDFVRQ